MADAASEQPIVLAGLGATARLPRGVSVIAGFDASRDEDGLVIELPTATTTASPALKFSTGRELGWAPTTAEEDLARNAERTRPELHTTPFDVAAQKAGSAGAWAIAYRWSRPEDCFIKGWAPAAHVWCGAVDLKIPCDVAPALLDACTSVAAAGSPDPVVANLAKTFPEVESGALPVLAALARAVVHEDRASLAREVSARGFQVFGKPITAAALAKDPRTLQRMFQIDCEPTATSINTQCAWRTSISKGGDIELFANQAFGVVTRMIVKRVNGRWWLTAVDNTDLGPP